MPALSRNVPLAVNTGSFWPATTEESIRFLQELDLSDVELTLQRHEFYLTFERELRMPFHSDLAAMIESGTLRVHSVHAPDMNAEHGHSLRAREEYLAHSLRVCRHLGGRILVTHPFHLFKSYEGTLDYLTGAVSNVWDALLPGIRSLLEQVRADNIVLSVENVKIWADDDTGFFNAPDNVKRFINDVAHPNLGLTLDVIHAQLIGYLNEFLDTLVHSIVNLHVADLVLPARRVPPGEGILDWEELVPILKRLPNLRQVTIELIRAEPAEVARAVGFVSSHWS